MDESGEPCGVHGELRRLPHSVAIRVLQALCLWTLVRGTLSLLSRWVLGRRNLARLNLQGDSLILQSETTSWGRSVRRITRVLPKEHLAEFTLQRAGESPAFTVGLVSISVGTFLGVRMISEGIFSGSVSLISLGPLLVALGVGLDFFVGSGRRLPEVREATQILIRASGERGWVISQVEAQAAEQLLSQVRSVEQRLFPPVQGTQASAPPPLSE